jgi:hypothetical protein
VLIIITGNYNFFNYITVLLCVPLLDDRFLSPFFSSWHSTTTTSTSSTPIHNSNNNNNKGRESGGWWNALGYLLLLGCFVVTAWITQLSLRVDWTLANSVQGWLSPPDLNNRRPMFSLAFDVQQWNTFLGKTIPYSLVAGGVMLALAGLYSLGQAFHHALYPSDSDPNPQQHSQQSQQQPQHNSGDQKKKKKSNTNSQSQHTHHNRRTSPHWSRYVIHLPWGIVKVVVLFAAASAIFAVSTVPFSNMAPETQRALPPAFINLYIATQNFRPVSGYGLFARMTTSRPEIIIEGSNDSVTWLPYEFKYKAGDLHRPPPIIGTYPITTHHTTPHPHYTLHTTHYTPHPHYTPHTVSLPNQPTNNNQTAPHQPRLDWQVSFTRILLFLYLKHNYSKYLFLSLYQMWFAALGQYNSNPWFVNLIAKLLTNNVDVVDLLENNPFPSTPPRMIRAQLWDYHFTQPTNGSLWGDIKASFSEKMNSASATSSTSASTSVSKRWWTRQPKSDYLPMLRYTSNSTSPPPPSSLSHSLSYFGSTVCPTNHWMLT